MMMQNLTILFPLAVALFALLWSLRWIRIHRLPLPEPAVPENPKKGRKARAQRRLMEKKDWIALGVITVVYAVVAFVGLGGTKAPQTFLDFLDANYYAQVDLGTEREISFMRYYPGLVTADYRLEVSTDGENWIEQTNAEGGPVMTQQYTDLYRWCEADFNDDNGPIRYVRIISGAEQELCEIALYDENGELIPASEYTVAPGCEMLVDEQDTVPDSMTFKNGTYFDEIYYTRTVRELIEGRWPYEITHPPLGKTIIGIGIRLFGMTPFGWRFSGVFCGILMLPALYILLKRMFGVTAAAGAGTTVFAFDFMHYVQTRICTIDTYAVFFTLMMFLFMYFWLTEPEGKRRQWWLALSGLCFGLGAASKWTSIYAGMGLAIVWAVYWIIRFVRDKKATLAPFKKNVLWCLLFFVAVPAVVYCLSYWSYAPSQGVTGLFRIFKPGYMKIVLGNQTYMFNYHSGLDATHPYSSKWYQWILDLRPILYYLDYFGDGTKSTFGAFSNPLLCWGGILAMGGLVWIAIRDRDERAIFILIGYLANLLPWVLVSRLTFAYHYFPCTVFLVLALGYLFADLCKRDGKWKASVGSFTAVCVGLFVVFYPVLSGMRVADKYTQYILKWFPDSWPF